ncbi:hypothetical protein EU523_01670, partial [Candidatus Heimdallarchaeota archaeon]
MLLRKLIANNKGVSNIISTVIITGIMVSSVALTYIYIMPTIDRVQLNSTLQTSSLFMTKIDNTVQSML